jgi:hypothetical protein
MCLIGRNGGRRPKSLAKRALSRWQRPFLPGPTCAPDHRQGSIPEGRGARSAASFDQASVQSRAPAALRRLCPDAGSHRTLNHFPGEVARESAMMSPSNPI